MILRVDPRLPLVWRSPTSAQVGVDPPAVVLPHVTAIQEKALSALVGGISRSGFRMLARSHPDECNDLLDALSHVLVATSLSTPDAHVAILGTTDPLVASIARVLAASGVRVTVAESAAQLCGLEADHDPGLDLDLDLDLDLVILVSHFVIEPTVHGHWLRRDVPHMPVVISDSAVEIGPVVSPGISACLLCVELHRRDNDPAWPAIAPQLIGRTSHANTPVLSAEAAAETARMALHRLGRAGYTVFDQTPADATSSVRIDFLTGRRDESLRFRHPDCGCQQVPSIASAAPDRQKHPESDWERDALPGLSAR